VTARAVAPRGSRTGGTRHGGTRHGGTAASARAELFRALGMLVEPPVPAHREVVSALGLDGHASPADHADVFLFAAYPYASVYLGAEGMLGGEARDRVAGFWRALGLTPPAEPDHVSALFGLYAALLDSEVAARHAGSSARAALRRQSRHALLWEHLTPWMVPWLAKVIEIAPPSYASWARLVADALQREAADLGPPATMPLALREAPALPDDEAERDAWIAALLAPVRCGVLLLRPDLQRAARDLGLGLRAGERAFMLRGLLEQDPTAMADWLVAEATRWAHDHGRLVPASGPIASFWRQRAAECAAAITRARPGQGRAGPSDGG